MEIDLQNLTFNNYRKQAKCVITYHDENHPHWSGDEDETSCYVTDTSDVHSMTSSDVDQADDELSDGSCLGSVRGEKIQESSSDTDDEGFGGRRGITRKIRKVESEDPDENNNIEKDEEVLVEYQENMRSFSEDAASVKAEMEEWNLVEMKEMRISRSRWSVLFVVCISIFVRSFVSVVFGQVNDVFSAYYNVPPGAADWLTTSGFLATLLVAPLVAKLGRGNANLRRLCCFMTGSASVGTVLLTTAVVVRGYGFFLAIAGQVVMGANNAVAMTIPPLVAAVWFPECETATSLALSLVSVGAGDALGSYIPPLLITGGQSDSIQLKLVTMFACTAGASMLTFIIAIAFVDEKPTFPPSKAQLSKKEIYDDTKYSGVSLLCDKGFMMVAFFYGISAASGANSITLLSSIMKVTFDKESSSNLDSVAGKIVSMMFVFFSLGPLIAGRLLDKWKCYRGITLVGLGGLAVGTSGIPLSLLFGSIGGLYVSHMFVGLFMGISETALFEIASEITYPQPEMDFSCILVMTWMAFFVTYPVIGRRALNTDVKGIVTSSVVASLVPAACIVACLILALFLLRPECKRREAVDAADPDKSEETTPLLSV